MKIITYNIHKGMDNKNKLSLNKIIRYLKKQKYDIICLQEVLYHQFIIIKKCLKLYGIFGANVIKPNMKYGICILSKSKIYDNRHIFLTSKKEQRGFLIGNVFSDKEDINIINTHLGLDKNERYNQINEILDYIPGLLENIILCGDFNEENINIDKFNDSAIITNNYNECTFEKSSSRIDYIFINKDINIKKYYVDKINMSDHYPVIVEI